MKTRYNMNRICKFAMLPLHTDFALNYFMLRFVAIMSLSCTTHVKLHLLNHVWKLCVAFKSVGLPDDKKGLCSRRDSVKPSYI